jgi:hypothetical protein
MELSFPATHARFVVQRKLVCQSNKTLEVVNIVLHSMQCKVILQPWTRDQPIQALGFPLMMKSLMFWFFL